MKRLILAPEAKHDLQDIRAHVADRDRAAAKRLLRRFRTKFNLLAHLPELGPAREELAPGLRSFPEGNYVIFYRPSAVGIEVARVLHGAQDIEAIFGGKR